MEKKNFHLKSMTAIGIGVEDFAYGRVTVEIHSVNRRFLEINTSLPKLLSRFEWDLRNWISSKVGRGALSVSVFWKDEGGRPYSVKPNLSLASAVKEAWEAIRVKLGVIEEVGLSLLAQEKNLLLYEEELRDEEQYRQALKKAAMDATKSLSEMKEKEGQKLASDLYNRIQFLRVTIDKIEKISPHAVEKLKEKLTHRLQEFFSKMEDNEDKILREIAIYAEKIDITEEIVRFRSHLDQFEEILVRGFDAENDTKGKILDFLVQELNREINTIGSKTAEKSATLLVIDVKGELEKVREQIQNIE